MNPRHDYQLNKLNPLQRHNDLSLTSEQKALQHQKAKAGPRKPKTVDYLTVPELSLSELPILYTSKYSGTPGNHPFRLNLYRLLLHIIYNTHRNNLAPQADFFPLHSQILRTLMGKDKGQTDYTQIRRDLIEWDYIEVNHYYSFNSKSDVAQGIEKETVSKSYRLAARIREGAFTVYRAIGIKYAEKTKKGIKGKAGAVPESNVQLHYAWLERNLARLSIMATAHHWIDEQERKRAKLKDKEVRIAGRWQRLINRYVTKEIADSYRNTVDEFNARYKDAKPSFSICITNSRLLSGLTNLARGLREFIAVDGVQDDLMYVDLSASQVYLLLPLLQATEAVKASNGEDFKCFSALVQGPRFYEDLAELMRAKCNGYQAEGDSKVSFFKYVIYSNTHKAYGFRKHFNDLFPVVNAGIMELFKSARENEEGLAVMLQKQEATLFLDEICGRLHRELGEPAFVATLHDGIICEAQHFDQVYSTMLETLEKETTFRPNLKVDSFQHPKPKAEPPQIKHDQFTVAPTRWLAQLLLRQVSMLEVMQLFVADAEEGVVQLDVHALLAQRWPCSADTGEQGCRVAHQVGEVLYRIQSLAA